MKMCDLRFVYTDKSTIVWSPAPIPPTHTPPTQPCTFTFKDTNHICNNVFKLFKKCALPVPMSSQVPFLGAFQSFEDLWKVFENLFKKMTQKGPKSLPKATPKVNRNR